MAKKKKRIHCIYYSNFLIVFATLILLFDIGGMRQLAYFLGKDSEESHSCKTVVEVEWKEKEFIESERLSSSFENRLRKL